MTTFWLVRDPETREPFRRRGNKIFNVGRDAKSTNEWRRLDARDAKAAPPCLYGTESAARGMATKHKAEAVEVELVEVRAKDAEPQPCTWCRSDRCIAATSRAEDDCTINGIPPRP